jgi:hypothetical protein
MAEKARHIVRHAKIFDAFSEPALVSTATVISGR